MMDYLAMNGYGFYVWGSYGVTALVLLIEVLALHARRRHAVTQARLGDYDSVPAAAEAVR